MHDAQHPRSLCRLAVAHDFSRQPCPRRGVIATPHGTLGGTDQSCTLTERGRPAPAGRASFSGRGHGVCLPGSSDTGQCGAALRNAPKTGGCDRALSPEHCATAQSADVLSAVHACYMAVPRGAVERAPGRATFPLETSRLGWSEHRRDRWVSQGLIHSYAAPHGAVGGAAVPSLTTRRPMVRGEIPRRVADSALMKQGGGWSSHTGDPHLHGEAGASSVRTQPLGRRVAFFFGGVWR